MLTGIRIAPEEDGFLSRKKIDQPGAYGKPSFNWEKALGRTTRVSYWEVTAPDGSGVILNPRTHTVTEHTDGTISVWPSIVTKSWHGWLEYGIWRSVDEHD